MAKDKSQRRDDLFTVDVLYRRAKRDGHITFIDIMEEVPCGLSKAYQIAKLMKLKYPLDITVENMIITCNSGSEKKE